MPLKEGASREAERENFKDFRNGKTFSKTKKKYGVKTARRQMIAAVLSEKRKSQKKRNARKR